MPGDPHGPNKLSDYINIHESAMARYAMDGFVLSDGTSLTSIGDGLWLLSGTVMCVGGLELEVEKVLEHHDGEGHLLRVQTSFYRYNARLVGHGVVFRYESPHSPTHKNYHHVHRYDLFNGDQDGKAEACSWPHLSQVIEELRDWYYDHYAKLNSM